jgi:DNA gyrase inhibitor GyrI
MVCLINEFNLETNYGQNITRKSNAIMNNLYTNYMDKIITGIIFTPQYSFWRYAEASDLIQEARTAIYLSILKQQYNNAKGTPFNFFSTVVSNTLKNFTTKGNRYYEKKSNADISKLYNNPSLMYNQNLDKNILFDNIIEMLIVYFEDKPKFQDLTILLAQHVHVNNCSNSKFIKKHFIQYVKAHNYSPAIANTFFNYLKRFATNRQIKELLYLIDHEYI